MAQHPKSTNFETATRGPPNYEHHCTVVLVNGVGPLNLLLSFQFLGVRILGSIATRSSQPVGVHGQRRFTATCGQHPLEVHSHLRLTASQAPWSIEVHSHLSSKLSALPINFLSPRRQLSSLRSNSIWRKRHRSSNGKTCEENLKLEVHSAWAMQCKCCGILGL